MVSDLHVGRIQACDVLGFKAPFSTAQSLVAPGR